MAPGQEERRGTRFQHPGMRWLRSTKSSLENLHRKSSPAPWTDIAAFGKKKTQTGSKNHSSRQVLARVAHGAPGMLQSRLLLVLEFPAGSKGKAGAPTLLKWPFSAGKRETGEVTARKAGGGKAGGSSAHGGESSSMELLPRAGTSWGFAPSPPSKHKNMGNVCNGTHEG